MVCASQVRSKECVSDKLVFCFYLLLGLHLLGATGQTRLMASPSAGFGASEISA